jgi:UDP-2,3-diacylglucosamine pyrophosphatase LpxH
VDGYEQYDEVYSISDLHLTTKPRVDTEAVASLAATIRALNQKAGARPSALVINGDIVDFLDIEPHCCFDAKTAPRKLRQVIKDNNDVFVALGEFARNGARKVVLTLGNHDLELAIPACQAILRHEIGGNLVLAFDGAGYRCRVGSAQALFIHGNNEDEWNVVDFDALGRVAASVNAGVEHEPWQPNEGTRLVIEVLNKNKAAHPFLEYLKPEGPWLLELIAKLGLATMLGQYAELAPRAARAKVAYKLRARTSEAAYLGGHSAASAAMLLDGDQLLLDADRRFRRGESVLVANEATTGTLGWFRKAPARDEEIRAHITKSLEGDQAYNIGLVDDVYRGVASKVGGEINFVVCGHTHLRRAVSLHQQRAYFNSGTWMRLLDLSPALAADQFPRVLEALRAKSVAELDALRWKDMQGTEQRLIKREPTVVILSARQGHVGWLADGVKAGATGADQTDFKPVANWTIGVTPAQQNPNAPSRDRRPS